MLGGRGRKTLLLLSLHFAACMRFSVIAYLEASRGCLKESVVCPRSCKAESERALPALHGVVFVFVVSSRITLMEENDRLLLELAQRSKGIEPMLDAVFSFLKRKTDFYVEQGPGDRVGFPPGEAQKIVLKCFNKFASAGGSAPDKKVLETMGTRLQNDSSGASQRLSTQLHQGLSAQPARSTHAPSSPNYSPSSPPAAAPSTTVHPTSLSTSSLPHYNGAALETYAWSQTLTDVTISIPTSPPCSAKSLTVTIEQSRVSIQRRDGTPCCLLQGDLPYVINASECMWNLDGNVVVS